MTARDELGRGPRVHLRAPRRADADEFIEAVRVSRGLHGRWSDPPATPDAFAAFLRRSREPTTDTSLVYRNDDRALVGVFNLSQIFRGHLQSAYLGYYAFEPHAGEGYMAEGLRLVLRRAFGPLGLHRVEANIQPENRRSKALVRSAGFEREGLSRRYLKIAGRWRDHERWSLLAEEFGRRRS